MGVGLKIKPEIHTEIDEYTGAKVSRLTSYRCNHNHLYFTNNSFYDHNTKIVINGDRGNVRNLYSVDLKTFEITQLTDFPELPYDQDYYLLVSAVDPVRNYCYFYKGRELCSLNLMTCELRVIYTIPDGFKNHIISCGSDSDYVYTSIYYYPAEAYPEIKNRPLTLREICVQHPVSKILRARYDGTLVEELFEENEFIAHVNIAPTNPDYLTFCHEGPWGLVDHRIWGMHIPSRKVWKVHEIQPGEKVGHEYWYQDGFHLGFHGHKPDGTRVMGRTAIDNSELVETVFPFNTGHIYSRDESLIVGDGEIQGKFIRLWKWDGEKYSEPLALCQHFCTFKKQDSHVHPVITPDNRHVLFTSDRSGYNQVYYAEIPEDLTTLPKLATLSEY